MCDGPVGSRLEPTVLSQLRGPSHICDLIPCRSIVWTGFPSSANGDVTDVDEPGAYEKVNKTHFL